MAENILRFIRWVVNKIGFGTLVGFTLLFVLFSSVVWWLNLFIGHLASPSFGTITFLALLLGWLLARSRLPGWLAAFLLGLVGLLVIVLLVGELVSPLASFAQSLIALGSSLRLWRPGQPLPDVSLSRLLAYDLAFRMADLTQRTWLWMRGMVQGAAGFDAQVAGLAWGSVLWCAAAWAAWGVRRRRQPLLAAIPVVAILAASLAFAREQLLYLVPAFGLVLGLQAWSQYSHRSQEWQRLGVDYATDIPYDLTLWIGAIVVVVGGVAILAAGPSPHQAVRMARSLLITRSQTAENIGQSLGLSPGAGQGQPVGISGTLPRQHLLGSGPELSQRVVYLVKVTEPSGVLSASSGTGLPVQESLYWQAVTYDFYNDRGWSTSPTNASAYGGGEGPAPSEQPRVDYWIDQEVRAIGDPGRQIIQAGDLAQVDQPYQLDLRDTPDGELDVFAARLDRSPGSGVYHAVSSLLAPDQAELAAAGYDYPQWIAKRYLELPPDLPARVQQLAEQITAGENTPYERAKAIEAYLRRIPYTLDLTAPPSGHDVVDYYLFELRRGYCDYAASAMVVLARSTGLPARLVVGYAPGHYDPSTGQVVITEAEAHSWPEIYFSGVGWVRFEPTGGRALSSLPIPPASSIAPKPPVLAVSPTPPVNCNLLWLGLAGVGTIFLVLLGWREWQAANRKGTETLSYIYTQIRRRSRRLGAPDSPGLTPSEVAAGLDFQITRIENTGRWKVILAPARAETQHLVALYIQAIYSPHAPAKAEVNAARSTWRKLRWRLWLLIIPLRWRYFSRTPQA